MSSGSGPTPDEHSRHYRGTHRSAASDRDRRRLFRFGVPLLALLLVGAIVVPTWAALRGRQDPQAAGTPEASASCPTRTQVGVVVPPQLRDLVARRGEVLTNTRGSCATYSVTGADSTAATNALREPAHRPRLWIAESPQRILAARSALPELKLAPRDPFAISPVVAATTTATATRLGSAGTLPLQRLVDPAVSLRLPAPADTATGETAVLAFHRALESPQQLEAVAAPVARPVVAPVTAAVGAALYRASTLPALTDSSPEWTSPKDGTVVLATEQQIAARAAAGSPLVAMPLAPGTLSLRYQAVTVPGGTAEETRAADALADALASPEGKQAVRDAGLRAPGDTQGPPVPTPQGRGHLTVTTLAAPPPQMATISRAQWVQMTTPLRVLAVFDTSGSMKQVVPGHGTRIGIAVQATSRAAERLPANAQAGLWEFSNHAGKRGNHREVLPMSTVGPPGGPERQKILAALARVPSTIGGDTPLYDTILDAVDELRKDPDPKRKRAVFVVTDGRNDNPSGLTLEQLLSRLGGGRDSGGQVHVLTVGVGPDTDPEALRRISAATGSDTLYARNPKDLDSVVQRALTTIAGG